MKDKIAKISKIFLVLGMILSMCFNSTGLNAVNAYDPSVPREFTRVKNIKYPEWWSRKIPSISKWSTWSCKYDGKWAFCLEADKNTPSSGIYPAEVIDNNPNVKKMLYYGFGGPAAHGVFAADYDLKTAMCPDDPLTNDDAKYLLTHIFLSGAYSGQWKGFDENLFNQTFGGTYGTNLMNIYREIIAMPDPGNGVSWEGNKNGNRALFKATYDKANNQQITNIVKLNGISTAEINIPLAYNVTIHLVGASSTQTGGVAKIYGGQSFYFTAPCQNSPSNFTSGNVCGSGCERFTALAIHDGNASNQAQGTWNIDPDDAQLYLNIEWLDFGSLELSKKNTNQNLINGAQFNVKSVSYDGYNQNVTVKDGKIKIDELLCGNYEVKEISAPNGYVLNTNTFTVKVEKDKTSSLNIVNQEPQGKITLTKEIDASKTNNLKGDASCEGVTFGLYANETIKNKAGTKTYYQKNDLVSKKKTDANGKIEWDDLPLGNYYIQEIKTNDSLVYNNQKINVSIEYENQTVSKIIRSAKSTNRVNMQKLEVFKSGEREGISGVVKGLQGAEFTWKLKSEVDHVGWDNAQTYAVITTNENGRAVTGYLPYGKYLVRETKTPKDYMTAPDFTVSVTKDSTEYPSIEQIKLIGVNNKPFASYVKLVKVDDETGKRVTLNSASFKIKDSNGNYVTQKVSGKKVDTFTTNSDTEIVPVVEKGTVTLPLMLNAGTYTIEEIKTPKGFLDLEKPVEFIISSTYDYDVDEDVDPTVEVRIRNKQPKGEIKLNKTVVDLDTDTDLVDKSDLSKIHFVLKAKEDIYSSIDGSLLFKKDQRITTKNSGATVDVGTEIGKGIYALSKDGHLTISNLPMVTEETSYYLQEVKTLDGCVLNSHKYDFSFKQTDTKTKLYSKTLEVVNETTHFEFNKTDVTGDKEVLGAQLTITDEDGNIIDQWISNDKVHSIEGLTVEKTYTLSETLTPNEYVKATSIKFTVKNSSELETVTMKDKQITISKNDAGGEEVTGALMQIINQDGQIIDEWYSEGKPHFAEGLEEGKSYTLHEDLSPLGFNLANDFTFVATKEKKNQNIEMIDTLTEVTKTDVDGKALKGATLSIVSTKTKNIIDQWITGQHILDLDKDIQSKLKENGKAEGSYFDDEDSMITFSITKNKDRNDYTLMKVKDGETTYANIDFQGYETTHRVQGLIAGESYILRETKTPEGYVNAKEIEFTADEIKNQMIVMKDKQIAISKSTLGGEEITGAFMQIIDEDGNIIDEWTSKEKIHYANGLVEGKTYTLHEDLAPTGLNLANDIDFTVSYDKVNQQVEMIDTINEVSKVDEANKSLKGAELTVISKKTKNIIDKWISGQHIFDITDDMKSQLTKNDKTSGMYVDEDDSTVTYSITKNKDQDDYRLVIIKDGTATYSNIDLNGDETSHMIEGLAAGEEYVLKETKTPDGYATFKETTFKAEEDKDTSLKMTDEDTKIEISKQDISNKKELEGAKLKITDKDGKTVEEWTSGKTPHMIKNLTSGQTYTLTEVTAPNGYDIAEAIQFTVEDTGNIQQVTMYDKHQPVKVITGDDTSYKYWIISALFSLGALLIVKIKTRKE